MPFVLCWMHDKPRRGAPVKFKMHTLRELAIKQALRQASQKAVPYAMRDYVNAQAFDARQNWQAIIPQKMKLRNGFTIGSIRVEKASSLSDPYAIVGSVAPYMNEQEEGAIESRKGRHGVALPAAAPGKRKTRGRVAPKNRPGAIRTLDANLPALGHRTRQIAVGLHMAEKRGGAHYAFLKMRKNRMGIYLLDPSKKKSVKKVIDLSKPRVTIPRNETMDPAVQRTMQKSQRLAFQALAKQINRVGWKR